MKKEVKAMNMDKKTYKRFAEAHAPRSPIGRNCLWAFVIGGGICVLGQGINDIYEYGFGMNHADALTLGASTLIFIAAALTAFGIFNDIAKLAGAGTLVPITGFANAVVSPAIDSRAEGLVLGVGARIFYIAGPVLLYGTLSGSIYGVVYWALKMI